MFREAIGLLLDTGSVIRTKIPVAAIMGKSGTVATEIWVRIDAPGMITVVYFIEGLAVSFTASGEFQVWWKDVESIQRTEKKVDEALAGYIATCAVFQEQQRGDLSIQSITDQVNRLLSLKKSRFKLTAHKVGRVLGTLGFETSRGQSGRYYIDSFDVKRLRELYGREIEGLLPMLEEIPGGTGVLV